MYAYGDPVGPGIAYHVYVLLVVLGNELRQDCMIMFFSIGTLCSSLCGIVVLLLLSFWDVAVDVDVDVDVM